jgi:ketosteroid isomerase-like protein
MAFATAQEAEQAFYRAFAAADFNAMKDVWAPQDSTCIHPGGTLLQEPETILKSWQHILSAQGAAELRVEVLYRQARKDHVIHVVREHFRNHSNRPAMPVLATNVYLLQSGGWRMCVHHASTETPPNKPAKRVSIH